MDKTPSISNLKLESCCIDLIDKINGIITSGNILQTILVSVEVLGHFFYPPGYSNLAGLASTTFSITSYDWRLMVQDIRTIQVFAKKRVHDLAGEHAIQHTADNKRNLQLFWEGIYYAFE